MFRDTGVCAMCVWCWVFGRFVLNLGIGCYWGRRNNLRFSFVPCVSHVFPVVGVVGAGGVFSMLSIGGVCFLVGGIFPGEFLSCVLLAGFCCLFPLADAGVSSKGLFFFVLYFP